MGSEDRPALVRICDPVGRPRGTGFVADDRGTVVTSHEAVDGLTQVVLRGPDGRDCRVGAADVVALPGLDLALLRTGGPSALGAEPAPIALRDRIDAGTYVTIAAHGWREARVLGTAPVTYTANGLCHRIDGALELALGTDGADALRLRGTAVGGPVVDPETGAVVAVLGTALRAGRPGAGFAVPLGRAGADGPLGALLRRNATGVPGYARDLNLAGALQLTATSLGAAGGPVGCPDPVERPGITAELTAFTFPACPPSATHGPAVVLGLVGAPGSGRSTELAALAARRARGRVPAPTVWLRGADLLADDDSVADAVARTLRRAGRIVATDGRTCPPPSGGDAAGDATPERVARLAAESGSPLLVLLDGPEEMPPALAHGPARWTAGTVDWLRANGARLVVACSPEHWETAGALCPPGALHRPAGPAGRTPYAVRLGDLTAAQAERARERYTIPPGALAPGHDRHPLTLRLFAEVREALPPDVAGRPDTEDVFGAHLDLMCLRVAVRIAAHSGPPPGGTAIRRLAARVAGQVHEAARRCLGPGQGELDRAAFEDVFPWRTGWASAVLAEGLIVPAGAGYRFAHEELGDWVQGAHLDLDAALHALVHRRHEEHEVHQKAAGRGEAPGRDTGAPQRAPRAGAAATGPRVPRPRRPRNHHDGPPAPGAPTTVMRTGTPAGTRVGHGGTPGDPSAPDTAAAGPARGPRALPVPRHRTGPVIQALLLLGRRQGPDALAHRLADLIEALDRLARGPAPAAGDRARHDARWWAAHLLSRTLLRVPDARPHLGVLRLLTGLVVRHTTTDGPGTPRTYAEFGPWFWRRLKLPEADRIDLLRRLVPADPPRRAGPRNERPGGDADERYLDTVARSLADRPRTVQPLLCAWFSDERPLPAGDGAGPHPTVADAARALLHARRDLAVDDLTDTLVSTAHPRAGELLAALAQDEPSALCRAVDRWARDEDHPGRRAAAASYALLTAAHATRDDDRGLLHAAADALLARPGDTALHGPALTLLVRDPRTRDRSLRQALRAFVAGEPPLPVEVLAEALPTHREQVLAALRERLVRPGGGAGEVLRALAGIDDPTPALHAADLVRAYAGTHPGGAADVAAYVDRRLEHGPAARALLLPLVTALLRGRPVSPPVRAALAGVLAAPGGPASGRLRGELLEVLLDFEQGAHRDPAVLEALLRAAAGGAAERSPARTRALVHRTGTLLVRTPEGAARFDRLLAALARDVPGFAALIADWLAGAPQEWAALVGPGARGAVTSATAPKPVPMRAAGREHGSLRPA
ncbi:trypsin-like peptidase domain-containing protein [Streptomyces sp. NPDC014734]|uniref:trypsin-like peptidase domain-containing protein n=1 Tax=Streptomyces sp. NPDC014734 TaxID=3364886 RepID=UPI0036F5884C